MEGIVREIMDLIEKSDGYIIGITTINGNELKHSLFTDKFPFTEMLKSHKKVKELIIAQLENDTPINEAPTGDDANNFLS